MYLTKKKAVDITIELWTFLAETGLRKGDWDGWEKYGKMRGGCPLCEYDSRRGGECDSCPYNERFGWCLEDNAFFDHWSQAANEQERKEYASLFLEQLKELK